MRRVRGDAEPRFAIGLILRVVPVKKEDRTVVFKREDMRCDPVKEPAVM